MSVICYGKPKPKGGNTIKIVKAKTTQVRTSVVTVS